MATETGEYRLSCGLRRHEDDIRPLISRLFSRRLVQLSRFPNPLPFRDPNPQHPRITGLIRRFRGKIRGICICGGLGIASSSRDKMVKFWTPDPEKKHRFVLSKTLAGHSSFVGPVAWIPPSDWFFEGAIVSGGMDTLVLLWDLSAGEVAETMKGHQQQVTGLSVDDNGDISRRPLTVQFGGRGKAIQLSFGKLIK